ncbi:MAG: pantothenate kinase, partial [Chloroflexi bacterium]
MLLVIDVGNSETMLGLYEGANLVAWWKLTTEAHRTADEYTVTLAALLSSRGVKGDAIKGMAVACVVPPLTPALREMAERFLKLTPVIVGPGVRTGIRILTDDPRE